MSVIRNIYNGFGQFIAKMSRERRGLYWTKLMKDNVSMLERNGIGGGNLSKLQVNSIRELYKGLPRFSLVFHTFYTKATGKFHTDYIPDALYYQYVDPYYNNWEMAKDIDHKGLYRLLFPDVRQPKLLAYRMNGFWYDSDGELIDIHQTILIISKYKSCFVKKAMDSEGGHGITFLEAAKLSHIDLKKILEQYSCDLVIQEGLTQSPVLSAINESSVNTIRLITLLRKDGTVKIYSVVLRMGIGGAKVDNASSGGITVGIEDDGRLKPVAYNAKGVRFDRHPTSHVMFDKYVIPNYQEVKQLVVEQAKKCPHFRLVSWDIALDKNNTPIMIEANLKYGELDFHQLNNGPLFGEDTKDILDEVFGCSL